MWVKWGSVLNVKKRRSLLLAIIQEPVLRQHPTRRSSNPPPLQVWLARTLYQEPRPKLTCRLNRPPRLFQEPRPKLTCRLNRPPRLFQESRPKLTCRFNRPPRLFQVLPPIILSLDPSYHPTSLGSRIPPPRPVLLETHFRPHHCRQRHRIPLTLISSQVNQRHRFSRLGPNGLLTNNQLKNKRRKKAQTERNGLVVMRTFIRLK